MPSLKKQLDQSHLKAIRGSFLDFIDDPFYGSEIDSVRYLADGLLVLADGKIRAFGPFAELQSE